MPKSITKIEPDVMMTTQGYRALNAYFGIVRAGYKEVITTPMGDRYNPNSLLDQWLQYLESNLTEWPTLLEYEKEQGEKFGPLSYMLPLKDRLEDIDHYYEDIHLSSKPITSVALRLVLREWGLQNPLQVREMSKTVELMRKSTNSGLPYFTKRRRVVNKTIPCACEQRGFTTLQNLQGTSWETAAVLGWRGQEGGHSKEDVKQRVVWMFPFAVNIKELQVYQPLIEAAQKFGIVPAWVGMDKVDEVITKLFDTKGDDYIVCTDFTKFDQHFNKHLQDGAKFIISNLLRKNQSSLDWLTNVFPVKFNIPMAANWNYLRYGPHGMASGSGGTNADETLVHRALQYEAAYKKNRVLNLSSQCLGDDGILSYPGINVDDVIETYTSHGQEMNADKQYVSKDDCIYLRRWHHKQYRKDGVCVGVYPTTRALGRMCYQERHMDDDYGPKAIALRQLSILENVKYHPLREQFVDFCMKRDKYRLGIDIPGFLANIEDEAQKLIDHMPDFLGYVKSQQYSNEPAAGIGSWWITNYLKSKS